MVVAPFCHATCLSLYDIDQCSLRAAMDRPLRRLGIELHHCESRVACHSAETKSARWGMVYCKYPRSQCPAHIIAAQPPRSSTVRAGLEDRHADFHESCTAWMIWPSDLYLSSRAKALSAQYCKSGPGGSACRRSKAQHGPVGSTGWSDRPIFATAAQWDRRWGL